MRRIEHHDADPPAPGRRGRHPVGAVATWSVGLVVLAGGIAATLQATRSADLGVGPLDVLSTALARRSGLDIGIAIGLLNAAMVLAARALGGRLAVATIATALAIGPLVDGWLAVHDAAGLEPTGVGAWALLLLGTAAIGSGGAIQISSGWGPSPLDELVVALAGRRWTLRRVRTALELSLAGVGALAGGALGPGTLVIALGVGPALGATMHALAPLRTRLATTRPGSADERGSSG